MSKDTDIFYVCDFEKNTACKGTVCQKECFSTSNPEFGIKDDAGKLKEVTVKKMRSAIKNKSGGI